MSTPNSQVKVGILKLGCVGTAPLLEYLLDERAERKDILFRIVSSGSKMLEEEAVEIAKKLVEFKPDFAIVVSPNATLPGPTKAREILRENGIPTIVVSDAPTKKIKEELEEKGFGYIIVLADSMIGARKEFLDPAEMSIFNADIIKVLAVTGVYNLMVQAIDKVIDAIKEGKEPELPKVVVNADKALEYSEFSNPYAKSKAMAAFEIAAAVSKLTTKACFKIKEWEVYTLVASAAHEMMRCAAMLADEAREIEKYGDTLTRKPHSKKGMLLVKKKLIEKPVKEGSS